MIVYLEFPVELRDCHQGMATLFEVSSRVRFFFFSNSFLVHVYVCSVCSYMCMHVEMYVHRLMFAQMRVSIYGHTYDDHRLKLMIFLDHPLLNSLRQGLSTEPRAS